MEAEAAADAEDSAEGIVVVAVVAAAGIATDIGIAVDDEDDDDEESSFSSLGRTTTSSSSLSLDKTVTSELLLLQELCGLGLVGGVRRGPTCFGRSLMLPGE